MKTTRMSAGRHQLYRLFLVVLLGIGLWLGGSLLVAHRLTCRRLARAPEPMPSVTWGRLESHRLRTRDGQELGAWFALGREDAPSVLLLHGNKGNRSKSLTRAQGYAARGCAVLMISHRAHGDSTGETNDFGYSARHDVVAAVEFLERRRPGRRVIVDGVSMGSAAAVFAARELGRRVHGYILECPYRDLETAVRNRTREWVPPFLDGVAYTGLRLVAPLVLPDVKAIAPVAAVAGVPESVPVLVLAGSHDRLARPEEARALYDRVKSHGRFAVIGRARHAKLLDTNPSLYWQHVTRFLEEAAPGGS
jgi:alpha-beta hydrolase superfamily lysophospholipase